MLLQTAISDYLLFAKHEQKVARTTYLTYTSWLHHFHLWLEANGYPAPCIDTLNTPLLRRYLYFLSEQGKRPRTIRSCFHPVRALCSFLVNNGTIPTNPVTPLTMPKKDAARRETCTDAEIMAVLRACEKLSSLRKITLARAVLSVFVYAGLRRAELCDLKTDDVNIAQKFLIVRSGKGAKSRKVFLCAECIDALREWIAVREQDSTTDYLFTQNRSRRVYHTTVYVILEEVKGIANLSHNKGISPHSLRHAAATRLMRNGVDIKSIQLFLGHSNLETTAVYLHSDEARLQQTAQFQSFQYQNTGGRGERQQGEKVTNKKDGKLHRTRLR